ncbi:DUF6457 domain-containing protein [Streptomyces sp. NPDC058955]|uniref:DUF6457 domain-containing protein n=1 Tax=unclassified Streptomyces TaxID=2593676 RepID=UPI0036653573
MRRWITAAEAEPGVDLDIDVPALLDMTRLVAHGVARPATPLTAFPVGHAAARAGGGETAVADADRKAAGPDGCRTVRHPDRTDAPGHTR